MKNEVIEKVDAYIKSLADSLGVAAEHVYGLLVKQQIVEGAVELLLFSIILISGFIFCKTISTKTKDFRENYKGKRITGLGEDILLFLIYASWVFYGLAVIIALCTFPSSIGKLINPEYYAIKEILDVLSK